MSMKITDLTQTVVEGIPDWNGCCGFQMQKTMDYSDGICVQEFKTPNGIGTHMDAPSHFIEGSSDISQISLGKLIGPGVMINVSSKANEDYAISLQDIIDFEQQHGKILGGSIVIGNTGWGKHWNSPEAYRNADHEGAMRFPKFSLDAIGFLLERGISGIAIDTLSPDGSDNTFPVHHKLLGAGKFIIENIKIPETLPASGFTIYALPVKIEGATEAPCRVIAVIKE